MPLTLMNISSIRHFQPQWGLVLLARYLFKQWRKPNRPKVDRGVVYQPASLLHHVREMALAQPLGGVPADTHQNDIARKAYPLVPCTGIPASTGQTRVIMTSPGVGAVWPVIR